MPSTKVSLTLDKHELAKARKFAGPRKLSGYVSNALRHANRRHELIKYLDELDARYGPISESARAEGDRIWESLNSSSTAAASRRSRRAKR